MKSLTGARYFEAKGRRANSLNHHLAIKSFWPSWAQYAYSRGYWYQDTCRFKDCIPKSVITHA